MWRIEYYIVCRETGWEWETVDLGMMQCAMYAVLSVCCTRCMLYSVLTIDYGMERAMTYFMFLGSGRVEDENERDERRWGKSSWETGT